MELSVRDELEAPVQAGEAAGYMSVVIDGEEAARTALIAAQAVEQRSFWFSVRRWLRNLTGFGRK